MSEKLFIFTMLYTNMNTMHLFHELQHIYDILRGGRQNWNEYNGKEISLKKQWPFVEGYLFTCLAPEAT